MNMAVNKHTECTTALKESLTVIEAAAKHFHARGEIEMWKKFHEYANRLETIIKKLEK